MNPGMKMMAMSRMGGEPEMRRQRDSRRRYMEGDEGNRMAYDGNREAYRPWPEPHIPPYLDRPGMADGTRRSGSERRDMEMDPHQMRDRNVVNIRDYQDKHRIGFGAKCKHHDDGQSSERLTAETATAWVEGMHNTDPEHPTGAKWSMETIKPLSVGHGFSTPDQQLEFWAVMNMMYSDYCGTAKKCTESAPWTFSPIWPRPGSGTRTPSKTRRQHTLSTASSNPARPSGRVFGMKKAPDHAGALMVTVSTNTPAARYSCKCSAEREVVELRGVEPLSEGSQTGLSPSAVCG